MTELEQFALDPAISPTGVLSCHPFYQRDDGVLDRRASGSSRIGPLPGHQTAVPPQDGAWRDQSMSAQQTGESPYQCGKYGAVSPVESWARVRAAQHSDLMPQYQQLHVLGRRGPAEQDKPLTEPHEGQLY